MPPAAVAEPAAAGEPPVVEEQRPAEPAARQGCPIPNLPEVDLASLPPIEALTAQSDFSVFLRPGVPSVLRNAALRRMWSLDPAIRDYIGPADYQWDFNAPGGLPFGFAEELRGDVGKLLAQAIGKLEPPEEEAEAEAITESAEPPSLPVAGPEEEPVPGASEAPMVESLPASQPEEVSPLPSRRRHGGALPA